MNVELPKADTSIRDSDKPSKKTNKELLLKEDKEYVDRDSLLFYPSVKL